jgi:hypothetical protein
MTDRQDRLARRDAGADSLAISEKEIVRGIGDALDFIAARRAAQKVTLRRLDNVLDRLEANVDRICAPGEGASVTRLSNYPTRVN